MRGTRRTAKSGRSKAALSVHVTVWCGDTPVVHRPLGARCERYKREGRAWSARWPASPKGRIETEPRGASQLRGVRRVARTAPSQLRVVAIRHGLECRLGSFRSHFALFWSFQLAIFEAGWTSPEKKKAPPLLNTAQINETELNPRFRP